MFRGAESRELKAKDIDILQTEEPSAVDCTRLKAPGRLGKDHGPAIAVQVR